MQSKASWLKASVLCGSVMFMMWLGDAWQSSAWAAQQTRTAATKTQAVQAAPVAAPAQPTVQSELTLWQILEMLDWTFWPFVFVTAAGLVMISLRALMDYQDRTRAKQLLLQAITPNTLNQFGNMVGAMTKSSASKLFTHLILTFNKTNRADSLSEETNNFITEERNAYETFNRVIAFLSDTSGALGLLGTVWGIFVTFYGGKLDGATILNGMGVALITTLVGLIVSIAFNFGSTTLFAMYNTHMKTVGGRAEELRQALLAVQRNPNVIRRNGAAPRRNGAPAEEFGESAYIGREGANGHAF